ncbi:MAG: hypothetical protein ABSC72_05920 [Methylovirgula sp.]|jgi:hypothetical protein
MKRVTVFSILTAAAVSAFMLSGAPQAVAQLPSKLTHPDPGDQPQQQIPQESQQARGVGPTRFDGTYGIEVATQDGTCGGSHWTVDVVHGQITSISPNTYNAYATGLIEDDGTVSMSLHGGNGDVVHVGGTVKTASGTGAWSSPTLLCGGTWRADKQK